MKVRATEYPNLFQNEQGVYYARVKVRQKTIWRSLKTNKKSRAATLLGDKLQEMRGAPEPTASELKASATFEEAVAVFKAKVNGSRRGAPRTKETKLRSEFTLRRTWPQVFSMELRRVTAAQLKGWLDRYIAKDSVYTPPRATKTRPGNSASTVNKAVQFLRDVFKLGVENGVCLSNPAMALEKSELPGRKELVIPSGAQFKAMVAHIRKGAGWGRRTGDLIEGLAYSGMRVGELRRVRWRHINMEAPPMLTVPGTKSDTSLRPLPMSAKFEALVRQIRARLPKEPDMEERVFKAKEASVSLSKACETVGVPHMTHHDLRHFFITKALQKGIPVHIVAGWVGHADGGVTLLKVYAHYMPEHAAAMAAKMDFD